METAWFFNMKVIVCLSSSYLTHHTEKIMVDGAQDRLKGLKENDGDDNSQDTAFLVEANISIINEVKKDEEMDARKSKRAASAKKIYASAEVRDIPGHFGADLFKSGRYVQPTNPYFVARIRPQRLNDLYIPIAVIKDKNIVFPPTVTLRDPKGKEWTSKVKVWNDGRTWLTGGWRSLCRWNHVEEEERIICEFVPSLGPGMVLQMTIVRG